MSKVYTLPTHAESWWMLVILPWCWVVKKVDRRPADAGSNQSLLYLDICCIGKHMEEHWSNGKNDQ